MLTIGLAGGSGSGKGMVCSFFEKLNFRAIDTDAVYREMTKPGGECVCALVEEFGEGILDVSGAIDRKALSAIVFSGSESEEKRDRLQAITHTLILNRVRIMLTEYEREAFAGVIVDAPLLFESGFHKECDIIVSVLADESIRIKRILSRDGISEEMARARIASQKSDDFLIANSDYIIVNNSSPTELEKQVLSVAEKILNIH